MDRRWTILRIARARLNLTQVDLANLAGLSESKVAKFETFRQHPTQDELKRLAAALEMPVSELTAADDANSGESFATMRHAKGTVTDTDRIVASGDAKGGSE